MQLQEKSIPTPWKVNGNFHGEGVLETKILEAKYEARGCKSKDRMWGEYGHFLGLHDIKNIISHLIKTLDMVLQEILHFSVKLFS